MTDTNSNVCGYQNNRTGILIAGFHQIFHDLSNPMHYDNQGRLSTFDENSPHYALDWREITDKKEWDRLMIEEGEMPAPATAKPTRTKPQPSTDLPG